MGSAHTTEKKKMPEDLLNLSNFSPGFIAKLKDKLESSTHQFSLDKEGLKQVFNCSNRECDIVFEYFDQNGDKKIDSYELLCAITMLSHSTLEEKAEILFDFYDFDKSKYITRDELVILMTNALTSLRAIAKEDPPKIKEIEKETDEFFSTADLNNDNKITLKEFKSYLKKNPTVLNILMNFNIAKKEDLGTDFGGGDLPECDSDLEAEINPPELHRDEKIDKAKQGVDFATAEGEGGLFSTEDVGGGDEFMAVKPWKGVIDHSVPSNYKPKKSDIDAPDANLKLEYVYGYRCHDVRNNLRYTPDDQFIYHTAALGIWMDPIKNVQKFHFGHKDDIMSFSLHPEGKIVATGEIGPKPLISIWDIETMEMITSFNGPLTKGISQLAFSPDGKYLAAGAMDDDHCVAVWEWENNEAALKSKGKKTSLVASGKGGRSPFHSMTFTPDSKELIGTCVKEVRFYTFNKGVIKGKTGTGWGKTKQQSVLCSTFMGRTLVTGTYSGMLLLWKGRSISKRVEAHKGACNAIWNRTAEEGFITGGNDGLVIVWNSNYEQVNTLNIKDQSINSYIPKVRSVCENSKGNKILVGTRGGEIIEFTGKKSVMHLKSHCQDELWGLACHPSEDQFYTVGQDWMLAIWDIKSRRQQKFARLDWASDVLEFSPDAKYIALGYKNGQVTVLDAKSFAIRAVRRDRKKEISEIRFDPETKIMAVGAQDSMIYLYNVQKKFKPLRKLKGHHSRILHIDFTEGAEALKSVCTSYEILFFDTSTGKQVTSGASDYKDENWDTYTARLGWHVQGIWPACADGSDINSVDRSPDGTVCATADDFGFVKLFKFPTPVEKANFHKYIGHSSHVTKVRFHKKVDYLISTGGNDKAVFQWKYNFDQEGADEANVSDDDDSDLDDEFKTQKFEGDQSIPPPKNDDDDEGGLFASEDVGGGDERLAVLPFKGEVDNSWPSDFKPPPNGATIPDENIVMEYVHGYRSFDMRDSVKYADDPNEIIYTSAAIGIVLKKNENEQRFFNQHRDDVVSMDIHPDRNICATGQMAERGRAKLVDLYVWDSDDCTILQRLAGFHRRAINVVRFSPNGKYLLSVGEDDNHSCAIYEWKTGRMVGSSKVGGAKMLTAAWKDDSEFVIAGVKEVKFFTMKGSRLDNKKGLFGKAGSVPICSSAFSFGGNLVTGTSKGKLLIWGGRKVKKEIKLSADSKHIWSVCATKNNCIVGDSAGTIYFLDNKFSVKDKIIVNTQFDPQIRSLDYLEDLDTLLIGTRGSEIYEYSEGKFTCYMRGHYDGEVWGWASHPEENLFVTCGGDKTVRIWSNREMIKASDPFEDDIKSVDWSSDGKFICVGGANGKAYNLDAESLEILGEVTSVLANKSKHWWLEDIKFSPDNTQFAFGTHGGLSKVELVTVDKSGKISKGKVIDVKMTSALTHLDWSVDGQFIVCNSQAYEIFWINAESYDRINASDSKDIEWYSWTCVLGFPVIGIWPGVDFTDVNTVCRSQNQKVLATGEDSSKVKLFRYPWYDEKAKAKEYFGHSSHLTEVKFSHKDDYLCTVGGNDKTVIFWRTDFGSGADKSESEQDDDEDYENIEDMEVAEDEFEDDIGAVKRRIVEQKKVAPKKPKEEEGMGLFEEEDAGGGDEFMAVKPWLGQMKEPSNYRKPPKNQEKPPTIALDLEWIHGYRARDSKNNIRILADGCIAYHAAAVGIVYDSEDHEQRFFNKHIDDITAIAFHSDERTVATGEIGPKPHIYIWDACTMQELVKIRGKLKKGIQSLSFSPSGKYLAACAIDVDHHCAVFDVKSGACLAINKGGGNQIVDIAMKDDSEFVTVGVRHFKQWKLKSGVLSNKNGKFGRGKYSNMIVNCTFFKNYWITGTLKGEVLVWNGTTVTKCVKGQHEGPVDAIEVYGDLIFTGGRQGNIAILDEKFNVIHSVSTSKLGGANPGVNAFAYDGSRLIVGTRGSEVYELNFSMTSNDISVKNEVTAGHFAPCRKDNNEVWGLSAIPDTDSYVSVGDDGTMRVFNATDKRMEKRIDLNLDIDGNPLPKDAQTKELNNGAKGRSIDISPKRTLAAVGFRDGSLRIYSTKDWKILTEKKDRKSWIQDVKFSPEGDYLAVASHERFIDIYSVDKKFKRICFLKGHTGAITHLDWSESGEGLHSVCNSYELLYWDMNSKSQDKHGASNFRDEEWHTWTCTLGWPVQGIWQPGMDGSDINAVDRSPLEHSDGYKILAIGDDTGKVRAFRYPSMIENSQSVIGNGHSSHVTMVKFSPNGDHLYTAGGNDQCIFQWRVGM